MLTISTRPVVCASRKHVACSASVVLMLIVLVGMIDGRGYDGQQKDAICDVCRPCQNNLKHSFD